MRRPSDIQPPIVSVRAPELDSLYPFRILVSDDTILHLTSPLRERLPHFTPGNTLTGNVVRTPYGDDALKAARMEVWRSPKASSIPFAFLGLTRLIPQSNQFLFIVLDLQFDRRRVSDEPPPMEGPRASNLAFGWSRALRTPLHLVIGMLDLLRLSDLNVEQRGYLQVATAAASELLRAAGDLSDLTGIAWAAPSEQFELVGLVSALESSYLPIARHKGLELVRQIDPKAAVDVEGPRTRIAQVFANLIGNAIRYTNTGKVELRVEKMENGAFRFEVRDTGIGISNAEARTIFEPRLSDDGGLGIGLALSRQIVDRLGGKLSFESREGVGSRFWFDVPLRPLLGGTKITPKSQSRLQRAVTPEAFSLGRPVALVVDDSLANVTIMRRYLEHLGYSTVPAASGEEAVQSWEQSDYSIVLLDLELPGIDGVETARRIRALEAKQNKQEVPIIALTAHSHPDDRIRCEEAGMDEYLTKPLLLAELRAVLDRFGADTTDQSEAPRIPTNAGLSLALEHAMALTASEEEIPKEAYEAFRSDSRTRLNQLQEVARKGDYVAIARLGHALRGSAAQLQLREISRQAEAVEVAAHAKDKARIFLSLKELTNELELFLRS